MDWDDLKPKPVKAIMVGEDLKSIGIAELEARIAALRAEIERVEAEIKSKRSHGEAASAFFKS